MFQDFLFHLFHSALFYFRSNQFIPLPVNVIISIESSSFKCLRNLSDVHVHASCIEIIIINPNGFQCEITLQNLISMSTKQAQ